MPITILNGSKIYYEDVGVGKETLVFGHSMLFNLRMFDDQVNFLKKDYRCVRYDFRGHGKTESPTGGYDLDSLTEDLLELIKKLSCYPCHIIGFSMGGMVALRAALKSPHLIKSLILIDTSSEPEPKSGMVRNKVMLFVANYIGLKPLSNKVMTMFFGKDFLTDPLRQGKRKFWKNCFVSNNRAGIVKAVKGVLQRDGITTRINQINIPTTILVGENDKLTDLDKAKLLESNLKNATLKIIPRAGHMSPIEEPDTVNTIILEHLKKWGL